MNCGLTKSPLRPGLGVLSDDRVRRRKEPLVVLAVPLVPALGVDVGCEERVVVPGDQLVAERAHRFGEPVVGGLRADPHRVAAGIGHLAHVEDRARGRRGEERHVRVPPRGPVHATVNGEDLRMAFQGCEHRVGGGQLAELAAERRLLFGSEVLVPEEDDEVVRERLADHRDHLGIERRRTDRGSRSQPRSRETGASCRGAR